MLLPSGQNKVTESEKKEELWLISSKEDAVTSSPPNEVQSNDKVHQDGMYATNANFEG